MNRSQDWLRQAERDLTAAENSAGTGLHAWAAFAAQQSAEKALKGLVQALHGAARGHSLTALVQQLPLAEPIPEALMDAARELDQVYITARYPNGFVSGCPADYFSEGTSKRLLEHARSILEFCRGKIS